MNFLFRLFLLLWPQTLILLAKTFYGLKIARQAPVGELDLELAIISFIGNLGIIQLVKVIYPRPKGLRLKYP